MAAQGQILAGGSCGDSDCPAIMNAGNDMVDVQGYPQADMRTPDGELIVRIPAALIVEAARVLVGVGPASGHAAAAGGTGAGAGGVGAGVGGTGGSARQR